MKTPVKLGLLIGGYATAFVIALAAMAIHQDANNAAQVSQGMAAEGESMTFLATFAVAAVPATAWALFLLRSYPRFWRFFSTGSLVFALSAIAAVAAFYATRMVDRSSPLAIWNILAVLRILIAPLFALLFMLSALFAPIKPARIALLGAMVIEGAAFAAVAVFWLGAFRN